jgi:hypothetical protein
VDKEKLSNPPVFVKLDSEEDPEPLDEPEPLEAAEVLEP